MELHSVQGAMAEHAGDKSLPWDGTQDRDLSPARMKYVKYMKDEKKKKRTNCQWEEKKGAPPRNRKQKNSEKQRDDGEKKQDFTLLPKSNAYCKNVAVKKEELEALAKTLKNLQESVKKQH